MYISIIDYLKLIKEVLHNLFDIDVKLFSQLVESLFGNFRQASFLLTLVESL